MAEFITKSGVLVDSSSNRESPQMLRPMAAPLPYTGIYDEEDNRWVNIGGERVLYYILNFMERLARARPS